MINPITTRGADYAHRIGLDKKRTFAHFNISSFAESSWEFMVFVLINGQFFIWLCTLSLIEVMQVMLNIDENEGVFAFAKFGFLNPIHICQNDKVYSNLTSF